MKANELQIGDLVFVGGIPRKVCSITRKKIGYHREEYASRLFYARMYEVFPIHLTTEILEKNGWVFNDVPFIDGWEFMGITICDWRISCGINISMNVRYVHELQRALRLCGLNELADSLKV